MTNQKNILYLTKAQAQTRRLYLTDGQVSWLHKMNKIEPFPLSRPSEIKSEPMVTCYDAHEEQQSRSMQKIMGALDMCTIKVPKPKKAKKKTRSIASRDHIGLKPRGHKYASHTIKTDGKFAATYAEMKKQGFLTTQETADILGCCRSSLTDQFKHGLNYLKHGKFYFYRREDVEQYLQKRLKKRV